MDFIEDLVIQRSLVIGKHFNIRTKGVLSKKKSKNDSIYFEGILIENQAFFL
jgi:hypothetical protein